MDNSNPQNQQAASIENMQIKMPSSFSAGKQYIPIGKQTNVNGKNIPAIPDFTEVPSGGEYSLISKNGTLQFATREITGFPQPPTSGKYIVVVIDGQIQYVQANQGPLQLFNNDLTWTNTESC